MRRPGGLAGGGDGGVALGDDGMLTREEREIAIRAAAAYPPGYGEQWGVELSGCRYA